MTDEPRDYEDEWNDLTERDLLEGIFIELTQIRALLSEAETSQESGPSMYECKKCGKTVKEGEREQHASGRHSAPGGMVESLFEEV